MIARIIVIVHVLGVKGEDRDAVSEINSVETALHHCRFDGFSNSSVTRILGEPKIIEVAIVLVLILFLDRLAVIAIIIADVCQNQGVGEVLLDQHSTSIQIGLDVVPVGPGRIPIDMR